MNLLLSLCSPWAGRSSVPSGQERKNRLSLLDASTSIHFLTQWSTKVLPTNSMPSSILRVPLNLFITYSETFHGCLPIVTTVEERLMYRKSEKQKCTDISVKDAYGLAEESKFKSTGGSTGERVHRCQQLPMKSIWAHKASPGDATARFAEEVQEIAWLIAEDRLCFYRVIMGSRASL